MKQDDSEILARIEAQIAVLNKKVDALMAEAQKPTERSSSYSNKSFDDRKSNKMQFKAVCSECGQTCGVPFKPSGGRPIFCSECFAKQQDGGASKDSRFDKKPRDFRRPATTGKKPYFKKK